MRFGFAWCGAIALAATVTASAIAAEPDTAPVTDPENTLYLDLTYGRVVIEMRPEWAPNHVARIKHLVRGGFYDGLAFHRVIAGFMAQTGDPFGTGSGGTGRKMKAEITRTPQGRGIVSMARSGKRDSADSQWFIVLADTQRKSLDGKYTAWGEVISGMNFVDDIRKGNERRNGSVTDPDHIVRLQVAADAARIADPAYTEVVTDELAGANAVTAGEFSATEFKCTALTPGPGIAAQSALARLWTHGFLAGYRKAQQNLNFSAGDDAAFRTSLRTLCASRPELYLLDAATQELAKAPSPLPPLTAAFAPATYVCKDYVAAQDGKAAAFIDLWAFGFIQGHKTVSQPGMEIPYDARTKILEAAVGACRQNPEIAYVDLMDLVAQKVKLK